MRESRDIDDFALPARGRSERWKRAVALGLVLVVCAALRGWLIAGAEVITRDGTVYVEMARAWSADPVGVARGYAYHVGYPATVSGLHALLGSLGLTDGVAGWDLSAQIASLVAALAATAAIWLFAGLSMGDWRLAWMTALLFGLGRKWAHLGADALSDAQALAFQMWGAVLALTVLGQLERRSRWAILTATGVGVCTTGGYLARPEGALTGGLAVLLWLAWLARRRSGAALTFAAAGATVLTAVLLAAPYYTTIGAFTHKKAVDDFVLAPTTTPGHPVSAVLAGSDYGGPRLLVNQLFEAMHPLLGFLLLAWLVTWIARRALRLSLPPRVLIFPAPAGGFLMASGTIVMGAVLLLMQRNVHYISHRHVMAVAALLSPLAGAGGLILTRWVALAAARVWKARSGRQEACERLVVPILLAAACAGLLVHALRPLHEGKGYYRDAAQIVRGLAGPGQSVLADSAWISHYSELPGVPLGGCRSSEALRDRARRADPPAAWLVVSRRETLEACPELREALVPPAFTPVREVPQRTDRKPDALLVYRVAPAALPAEAAR